MSAISKELLEILRCPLAVQEKNKYGTDPGKLELVKDAWLVSADSGLKYPIRNGIPVMLIDEGTRWKDTLIEDLPVPPPAAAPLTSANAGDTSSSSLVSNNSGLSTKKKVGLAAILIGAVLWLKKRN